MTPISRPSKSTWLQHLAPGGAEGPQQRELAHALRHGDRERVEDDERADEHRDAGEREQRRAQEAEVVADVLGVLVGLLLAGADVDVLQPDLPDLGCAAAPARRRTSPTTRISSNSPCLPESFWASGSVVTIATKPPTEDTPPNFARPTTSMFWRGPAAPTTWMVSPILTFSSLAVDCSSPTWLSASGRWPSTNCSASNGGGVSEKIWVGAPPVSLPMRSPLAVNAAAFSVPAAPTALATPGTRWTRAR